MGKAVLELFFPPYCHKRLFSYSWHYVFLLVYSFFLCKFTQKYYNEQIFFKINTKMSGFFLHNP